MNDSTELEMKVAFLEQALEQLSEEFYQQQKILTQMQKQQGALIDKMSRMQNNNSNEVASMSDERPPHY